LTPVPPARLLLRAKDLIDARYFEPLDVPERAAALLRTTDRSVADICMTVGLRSVGSFTTSFGRTFGVSPTGHLTGPARPRAAHPRYTDRRRART